MSFEEEKKDISEEAKSVSSFKDELFDWVQNVAVILTAIVLIFIFAFRIVGVDGESMMPTLKDKDWLIISDLFYAPEKGDIVVLAKESFMDGKMIVKRVIATEGQTVDIDFSEGTVSVDGRVLDEPYTADGTYRNLGMVFPVTVPEGCVFVLGDNRNYSADSRDLRLGMVEEECIIGRLLIRILPIKSFGGVE